MEPIVNTYKPVIRNMALSIFVSWIGIGQLYCQQFTENEVKSAYVYNFTKFIDWPDSTFSNASKPFTIGFYGHSEIEDVIRQTLTGRDIKGIEWRIEFFDDPDKIECNLLIVTGQDKKQLENLFIKIKGKSILTIGNEVELFCESGGMINFTKRHEKKQFEINNEAAIRCKLVISSKLLALAKIVTDEEDIF